MRETDLLPFYNRLAKLEGLMEAMHLSLQDSKREATRYLERVDRLESRQLDIERRMVTSEQFQDLSNKVATLVSSDAERKGSGSAIRFHLTTLVAVIAVLVATGQAVLPSLINQPQPQQIAPPVPAKP